MRSTRRHGELRVVGQRETHRKLSAASRIRYDQSVDYGSVKSQLATVPARPDRCSTSTILKDMAQQKNLVALAYHEQSEVGTRRPTVAYPGSRIQEFQPVALPEGELGYGLPLSLRMYTSLAIFYLRITPVGSDRLLVNTTRFPVPATDSQSLNLA